ncbi:hypothetical protein [Simkania sp.]|uniref:hypothetical protein n=1 Tax=Simkania sp. TaxID=34094 RepID=UPI003B519996
MKRFLFMMLSSLAFFSMTCHGDNTNPLQQVFYDLMVNEELFAQADENKQIIASSDYIYAVDQAIENFCYNYNSLQSYDKINLLGVIQIMLTSGLIKSGGSDSYYAAYTSQTTLQVLITGLANDREKMTHFIAEMNEFIVTNQAQFPSSGQYSPTAQDDLKTLMTLNSYLTQLNLNPILIMKSDFLNNLYNAFNNAEPLLGKYGLDLMLFDLDLVGAGLYQYNSNVLPPTFLNPTFQSASELQPLMVSLITGANELYFSEMNSHLQMGINTILENGY